MKVAAEYAVEGLTPSRVSTPATLEQLAAALREASKMNEAAIPWGGGTRMHVGGIPRRYGVAIDTTRLDRVLEYEPADLTVTVEAGVRVGALRAELARKGQRLPYDPPFPERATIGGSLASNAVGPLRSGFGGVRDLVIGMKVVQADGVVTKSGGKVVKNVSGYDLMRPNIGAFGTLGVIAEVSFKLVPLPATTRTYAAGFMSIEDARTASDALLLAPFQPERFTLISGHTAGRFVAAWSGSEPVAGHDAHLLVLTLAAGRAAVERMVNETRSIVERAGSWWHGVVDEVEADRFWAGLEPGALHDLNPSGGRGDQTRGDPKLPLVSVRATLKPSSGFAYIQSLQGAAETVGFDLGTVFHVGFGTVEAHFSPAESTAGTADDPDTAARVGGLARDAAAAHGSVAVIERCPTDLKRRFDVWGADGPSVAIMRDMKKQYDPGGAINPGRFVGGI